MLIISGIGIITSMLFALFLIKKKTSSYSDKILLIWMLIFIIHLFLPFMMSLGNLFFIEKVDGLDIGLYTLHITLLYYYTLSITNKIKSFKLAHLLYLLPTILIYVFQQAIDSKTHLFTRLIEEYFFNEKWIFHLTSVVTLNMVFCIYFADKQLRIISEYRRQLKNNFSYCKNIDLTWLKNLSIAALIMTAVTFGFLIGLVNGYLSGGMLNFIYFSVISSFAVVLGFMGIQQKKIVLFVKDHSEKSKEDSLENDSILDAKKNLKGNPDIEKILEIMQDKKPYLDPGLNINILAHMMGFHSHQLSKILNQYFKQNFFEFVNNYRIEEFKKQVVNPKNKHFSILALALDCGFNSKASFNRIFKNTTGQTPSEFRSNFIK